MAVWSWVKYLPSPSLKTPENGANTTKCMGFKKNTHTLIGCWPQRAEKRVVAGKPSPLELEILA